MLTFLGIEIDSLNMVARLLWDKKDAMGALLRVMLAKEKVRVREVQVLLGPLNFACRMVRAGQTF